MRTRSAMILFLLALSSIFHPQPARSGPNEGGVLVVHATDMLYSDGSQYSGLSGVACGQDGPEFPAIQVCPPYDPIDGANPCIPNAANPTSAVAADTPHVWYVMAAFPVPSCPRLKAVSFRIDYLESKMAIVGSGLDPECFELQFQSDLTPRPFPAPGSGTAVSFVTPKTSRLQEIYWFAGYAYGGATDVTFSLRERSFTDNVFVDDDTPANTDPILGFGTLGLGGTVGSNPYPTTLPPLGACCYSNGSCVVNYGIDCSGSWTQGTSCDPNPCAQPMGACCHDDGSCAVTLLVDCPGEWLSQGDCTSNPCIQPPAACCLPGGGCEFVPAWLCTEHGGVSLGYPSTCTPNPCDEPLGACCFADGSCVAVPQAECAGQWLGQGTTCTPNPCPHPTGEGACCFTDGSCQLLGSDACGAAGGSYQAGNCDPNPCPPSPVTGACCFPDGACAVVTEAVCLQDSGEYQGDAAPCPPGLCPVPTPTERTSWGQIKARYR